MSFRNEARDRKDWYDSVLARLDDLERQRPCDCVCNCCEGTIWLSTTLRHGATTWTSRDGDTRTLDPIPAATNADGGIIWSANPLDHLDLRLIVDPGGLPTLPATGLLEVEFDVTTYWDHPGGVEHFTYFFFHDDIRGRVRIVPPADFNTYPDREYALKGYIDLYDTTDRIDSNPTAVGLTGFTRGRFRAELDLTSYDSEFFLSTDGGSFVSQGTKTFPGAAREPYDGFHFHNYFNETDVGGAPQYNEPNYQTRCVLHGFSIINDGVDIGTMTETQILAERSSLQVDLFPTEQTHQVNATRELAGPFVFAVGGAPLMIRKYTSGTQDPDITGTPKIFTDGPDLVEPAICWAPADRPDNIRITNEDPKTWEPPATGNPSDSAVIYGVADLVGFDDLTDGWPTDTWPLGDILL